jgi:ParB family transcriptional regulator, chromosome partitioning protein
MTRKALGRGLGALLSADKSNAIVEEAFQIDIGLLEPSPVQPRTRFEEGALRGLAESIRENGLVQPVVVRRKGARFELIAGERRWRAAQLAGLERIPAVVRDVPDDKLLELALIENIQREDLNAIEEALAYKSLIESAGLTQESLAQRVGRDRSYITNYLRLLRLPEDLQRLVQDGKLSTGHARTLLAATDVALQRRLAKRIIEKGLSVRDTERLIRRLVSGETPGATKTASRKRAEDPNVKAAEARLRRKLGTRVCILGNAGGVGGRIEIDYYNALDLDRFYGLLMTSSPPGSQ